MCKKTSTENEILKVHALRLLLILSLSAARSFLDFTTSN